MADRPQSFKPRRVPSHYHRWTAEEDSLIGTMPDEYLAKKIGVSHGAVYARRNIHGLPPFKRWQMPWTKEEDALLGSDTDPVIGRKIGRSWERVRDRRRLLGLRSYQPRHRSWTRAEESLLGTMSDRKLARLLKRTAQSVCRRRIVNHVPNFNPRNHRWTSADDKLLGARPDDQVAMLLKVSANAVKRRRTHKRIPRFGSNAPHPHRKSLNHEPWTPGEEALLGKFPDKDVAARIGRTVQAVQYRRCRKFGRRAHKRLTSKLRFSAHKQITRWPPRGKSLKSPL